MSIVPYIVQVPFLVEQYLMVHWWQDLLLDVSIPYSFSVTVRPKQLICFWNNLHFFALTLKSFSLNIWNTLREWSTCESKWSEYTSTSSKQGNVNSSLTSVKQFSIYLWKSAGALESPNETLIHSYKHPRCNKCG